MKKLALVASILGLVSGSVYAADLPVKAAPVPPAPVIDWSGFYVGGHAGYQWADVHDTTLAGYVGDSTVKQGVVGGHAGLQWQFGRTQWASFVLGVEGSYTTPFERNDVANFTFCANPAFLCGLTNIHDLWTVGGRAGIAFDRFLITGSGGYANAVMARADFFPPTARFNTGGGGSFEHHGGYYAGAALEYMFWRLSPLNVDVIAGIDYKHVWLDSQGDRDLNGVIHTLSSQMDMVTGRLTFKFNPFGSAAVVAKY